MLDPKSFWIPFVMGVVFIGNGVLLIVSERFTEWGLNQGKARLWVRLLGMDRAKKLSRYVFAPLVIILGIAAVAAAFLFSV